MFKSSGFLLTLGVLSLLIAVVADGHVADGLAKAMAGVFLCLFLIVRLFGPDSIGPMGHRVGEGGATPDKRHNSLQAWESSKH